MKNYIKILLCLLTILLFSCDNNEVVIAETTTETEFISEEIIVYGHTVPQFSHDGGIYTDSLTISFLIPDDIKGCTIRYTTNGDEPTMKSDIYDSPIEILMKKEAVVFRAACFDNDGNILGNIITNTYIKADPDRFTTDIICITADKNDLYGSKGIINNSTMSGSDWERPAHIEYYEVDGNNIINTDAGLRIFGGSSRILEQKSFRIIARKSNYFDNIKYEGKGSFRYKLFENRDVDKFDKFILRNGGNDSLQSTAADSLYMTLLRDSVANLFISKVSDNVDYQDSKFVTVYLNGEYYGILDMKEYIDDKYVENLYGYEKDKIVIIKSELDTSRSCSYHSNGGQCRFCDVWFYYDVEEDNEADVNELIDMCQTAINADESNYEEVYNNITGNYIDINNFIEYTAINLFICNTDWPHNNIRIWRYDGGKFHFAARDMDFAFGRYENLVLPEIYTMADTNTFMRMLGNYIMGEYSFDINSGLYPDSLYLQGLLDFLLRNDDFKLQFYDYCVYLASDECIEILNEIILKQAESIDTEIDYHIKKWSSSINGRYDKDNWKTQILAMSEWANQRSNYFLSYLDNIMQYYN